MMPALNFQKQFASKVESGEKRQTIRRVRKRPIKIGDRLQLYTGQRTKRCELLMTATCLSCSPVLINEHSVAVEKDGTVEFWTEGMAAEWFASQHGFQSWPDMREWFDERYGLPFEGLLITW